MSRKIAILMMIILIISSIPFFFDSVLSIGTVEVTITLDEISYPGSDPEEPLDLYEHDGYTFVNLSGSVILESNSPHVVQSITVELNATPLHYWDEYNSHINYWYEPQRLFFSNIIPGNTYEMNFTVRIQVDFYYCPNDNGILIGGEWRNEPGALSGSIDQIELPLYILPYSSGEINGLHYNWRRLPLNGEVTARCHIYRYGNIQYPNYEVLLHGIEEARLKGIEIIYHTEWSPDRFLYGRTDIQITTRNAKSGDSVNIPIFLIDQDNDTVLDSIVWYLEVEEKINGDDDNPIDNNDNDDLGGSNNTGPNDDKDNKNSINFTIIILIIILVAIILIIGLFIYRKSIY
ncbi:MAG: hypothetical protein GF411_20095 [Candidatus Lokiarchaeota archaeon]|nr:hypothetical protein [Candidatus Lokiarchaeota archaeon]